MRSLILSDLHANLEALRAVLAAASGAYDRIVCCGDLVGYGADPNAVVEWARREVSLVVRGNHDKACCGLEDMEWFNVAARTADEWTRAQLTPENLDYLLNLPKGPVSAGGFDILHGAPADEDEYLIHVHEAAYAYRYLAVPLSFFGHTHHQGGFVFHSNGVQQLRKLAPGVDQYDLRLEPGFTYLLNPGSVGQPRDHDNRAAFLIHDDQAAVASFRRVDYPIEAAQEKIFRAGLPRSLAARLAIGA